MNRNLISLFLFTAILFPSGGYDHGTSAGKGKWDISLTWNPFNYFKHGQSYIVFGYGLTERFDIHGYYSHSFNKNDNYYGGFSYQFYKSKYLDLSTAIGMRKYIDNSDTHFFFPQLLYSVNFNDRISLRGSFVDIKNENGNLGITKDIFLMINLHENKKYKFDITVGAFNPVLWKPDNSNWYPTYSLDIKIK